MIFARFRVWALMIAASMLVTAHAYGQVNADDPRELALDIYSGINRSMPPASIALKLEKIIEVFRYRCSRVTDYQVFSLRPNVTDLKVKCSGDPLYGVTVASNGYVTVYGGNGILNGLDRRDAVIYSFSAEGDLAFDSSLSAADVLDETVSRIELGSEYNYLYILGMFMLVFAVMIIGGVLWWRTWNKKASRKPRERMKPMQMHSIRPDSSLKDEIFRESVPITKFIRKHPAGLYIAVGKRGKRRFFQKYIWAMTYARFGIKLFEDHASVQRLTKMVEDETAKPY